MCHHKFFRANQSANKMLFIQFINLGGFWCWVRCPVLLGLCLMAKKTERGVTITLFIIFDFNNSQVKNFYNEH